MVLGRIGLGVLYVVVNELCFGNYVFEYDIVIVKKIVWVFCGGDLIGI